MTTKLVHDVTWSGSNIEASFTQQCNAFLSGNEVTVFNLAFDLVAPLLSQRWVLMTGGDVYCHKVQALWWQLSVENTCDIDFYFNGGGSGLRDLDAGWETPTEDELNFLRLSDTGLSFLNAKYHGGVFSCLSGDSDSVPIFRLGLGNKKISDKLVLLRWLELQHVPEELKSNIDYLELLTLFESFKLVWSDNGMVQSSALAQSTLEKGNFSPLVKFSLLNADHIRADLKPYTSKILEDTEQGHWDLWGNEFKEGGDILLPLSRPLVARDPASCLVDGYVGIDFGTKSTVVVCQEDSVKINPMRIGTGDLSRAISSSHYENPTIMELNDLQAFMADYQSQVGRPTTKWQNLTVSHTAFSGLINSRSVDYNAYISDLKQWAGTANRRLKAIDKQGHVLDLPDFLGLAETDVNPIEIYAYYLGLYINNLNNGIFMNYILSFPVTYELEICDKIIMSFEKGLKKSLPQALHNQPDKLAQFSVIKGASEPAAYAIVALQEFGFAPTADEKVFYGVFDFGGGTTDFDFGIYRETKENNKKERRFDYVLEHFGAGGDRYLGGENLLALLAFEVFKENHLILLEGAIQFMLPAECHKFPGSEMLLCQSREAKMNMKTLIEALRPFWEASFTEIGEFTDSEIEVNLINDKGQKSVNFALELDYDRLKSVIQNRIEIGVVNFFEQLRLAFGNTGPALNDIDKVFIFLAGNSSKSEFVKSAFERAIEKEEALLDKADSFTLYPPLDNDGNVEKPTGKTGVAFGLIETREGGDILVIDHNIAEGQEIVFKYYLGESRKKKFKQIIGRDQVYQEWIPFVGADYKTFELYYSAQAQVSTNNVAINDRSIKKKVLKLDEIHEDAWVYIRLVKPTQLEYVVALEGEIKNENNLGKTYLVNL